MEESYPESFQSTLRGSFGKFDHRNGSGCKLTTLGPRKLIKKINYCILSIGMCFDYSNNLQKPQSVYSSIGLSLKRYNYIG